MLFSTKFTIRDKIAKFPLFEKLIFNHADIDYTKDWDQSLTEYNLLFFCPMISYSPDMSVIISRPFSIT